MIWHRAVAVNFWRGRVSREVDIRCPVCPRRSEESVLHRFWECTSAQHAWQLAIHVINTLVAGRDAHGPWQILSWKQGIFSHRIPRKFDSVKRIWMEIRTAVLWSLWLERNDVVFNNTRWTEERMRQHVWSEILDYGRVEWDRIKVKRKTDDTAAALMTDLFRERRCMQGVFATFCDDKPRWQPFGPVVGFVFRPY